MSDSTRHILLDPLTDREVDVLRGMAEGLSNREIAEQLIIGVETVRWYTKQIYSKMGVHSRTQASMRARELGLLDSPDITTTQEMYLPPLSNLPMPTTTFVGRANEIGDLIDLLREPHTRLVTLVGPGGVGKSRLAIEVAQLLTVDFTDGIYYVPLQRLHSVDEVVNAIGVAMNRHVEAEEQLLAHIQSRNLLLVLDGFEQLLESADLIVRILESSPQVKALVTSQVSLNLHGEWVRQLDGMDIPANTSDQALTESGAFQLFVDRVRRVRQDFSPEDHQECIIEICRLVRGLPLAIELATAWLKTLACEDVARQIRQNIDFLATNQPDVEDRHRSIRAIFDYAWNLLDDEEKKTFRRLSIFRGGFGLSAAEQVTNASLLTLSSLVDKSLIHQTATGLYEFHDMLRRYAEMKLEQNDGRTRSTRSKILVGWAALVKGNFDRVEELAQATLSTVLDSTETPDKAFSLSILGVLAGIEEDYTRCLQLVDACSPAQLNNPITLVFYHLAQAVGHCGLEDYQTAHQHAQIALNQAQNLRIPAFTTISLPVMAIIVAYEAEPERATELLALAFMHPASTPGWMEQWPLLDRLRADLEDELGQQEFRTLWMQGAALNLDNVINELLSS